MAHFAFRSFGSPMWLLVFVIAAQADVPRLIHYQGKLRDAGGAAVTSTVSLRFRIYNDASSASPVLFDESHANVSMTNGLFNVLIGSQSGGVPDSALDASEVWLGVSVNDGDELSPRSRIGSEPHAIKARSAERLVVPGTFAPAVTVDGSGNVGVGTESPAATLHVAGDLNVEGNVGVGTSSPEAPLHVAGDLKVDGGIATGSNIDLDAPNDSWSLSITSSGRPLEFRPGGATPTVVFEREEPSNATHLIVKQGGNVGIGTTDPGAKLEVSGQVKITGGSPQNGSVLTSDADGLASWQSAPASGQWSDAGAYIHADNATDVVVTDAGDVGVGVTSPAARLDVFGTVGDLFHAASPGGAPVYGSWIQHTAAAGWPGSRNAEITYDGKLWILSGSNGVSVLSDVWYTTNGSAWTRVTDAPGWEGRFDATATDFDGRLWFTAGEATGQVFKNDVWYTTNGASWTRATSAASWTRRANHGMVTFAGRMWIMGGAELVGGSWSIFRDVWYSTDGAAWTIATSTANWAARLWPASTVHDGRMWVFSGWDGGNPGNRNDVWHSTDGAAWTQATSSAPWAARATVPPVAYDGRLWVLAGSAADAFNDVWYSTNGADWTQMTATAPWQKRYYHSAIGYAGKLWLLGGRYDPAFMNDVWSIESSAGAASFTISNEGSVSASTLAVNGPVYSNGTMLTNVNPSSMDYKENVRPARLDPQRALALAPKTFRWKSNGHEDVGYIAEEVRAVLPELYRDDGHTKGYDAAKLPIYTLELLKRQQEELAALKDKVECLEAELQEFKSGSGGKE